tara:strand:+ start:1342 stop:1551 length:210 start_codon:yes stop_codon:yes gene_type:complete
MNLREKLDNRMDQIQEWMESNYHLDHPEEVSAMIDKVSFAWEVLSEEDRDYVQGCQYAIEENMKWGSNE